MEPTPYKSPLPCFGFELDLHTDRCRVCSHQLACVKMMGRRGNRLTLDKATFNIVPPAFKGRADANDDDDPEFVYMDRVYSLCYSSIFDKHVAVSLKKHRSAIAEKAKAAKCSIRLYMLAAMMGHLRSQDEILGHTHGGYAAEMNPKHLLSSRAEEHVRIYADICRKKFGAFTIAELDMLHSGNIVTDDIQTRMLHSEVIAGKFIVAAKAKGEAEIEQALYSRYEIALDPHWLAIEPSYAELILRPFLKKKFGNTADQHHRQATLKIVGFLKAHAAAAHAVHLARNFVMKPALSRVLDSHRRSLDDFEIEAVPVTDAVAFWKDLGRALQHVFCLNLYDQARALGS